MLEDRDSRNVCDVIVPNDLCVGCGTCAGTCPVQCLEMRLNERAEYNPVITGECIRCGLCLRVCPFELTGQDNEDDIAHNLFGRLEGIERCAEVGYHLRCHAGRLASEERLMTRSSGGIGSWLLAKLLERGVVQSVFCVVPDPAPDKRARFACLRSAEEVWHASCSYYGPVELSAAIQAIRRQEGKAAVVGLPCFLKGIRKAAMTDRRLANRLGMLVGLVCGQLKGRWFGDYLVRMLGLNETKTSRICFRYKDPQQPTRQSTFAAWTGAESECRTLRWFDGFGAAWNYGYFKLNACNYCDDVFAELADVALMDAWLPQYADQLHGQSLIVARAGLVSQLLDEGAASGELLLKDESVASVIRSQAGVLREKRDLLSCRLDLASQRGLTVPAKRVRSRASGILDTALVRLRLTTERQSKEAFARQRTAGAGLATFDRAMAGLRRKDVILQRTAGLLRLPGRAVKKLRRILARKS